MTFRIIRKLIVPFVNANFEGRVWGIFFFWVGERFLFILHEKNLHIHSHFANWKLCKFQISSLLFLCSSWRASSKITFNFHFSFGKKKVCGKIRETEQQRKRYIQNQICFDWSSLSLCNCENQIEIYIFVTFVRKNSDLQWMFSVEIWKWSSFHNSFDWLFSFLNLTII